MFHIHVQVPSFQGLAATVPLEGEIVSATLKYTSDLVSGGLFFVVFLLSLFLATLTMLMHTLINAPYASN